MLDLCYTNVSFVGRVVLAISQKNFGNPKEVTSKIWPAKILWFRSLCLSPLSLSLSRCFPLYLSHATQETLVTFRVAQAEHNPLYLCIYLSICSSIHPVGLNYLSVYVPACLSVYLSVYLNKYEKDPILPPWPSVPVERELHCLPEP